MIQNTSVVPEWGFEVEVTPPSLANLNNAAGGASTAFKPTSLLFPALAFTSPSLGAEIRQFSYTGLLKPYPLRKQFSEFSITFIMEDTFKSLDLFDEWYNYMFTGPKGQYVQEYDESLLGRVKVEYFGHPKVKTNKVGIPNTPFQAEVKTESKNSRIYDFINAFPTAILPVQFNQGLKNSFQTFTVNFGFEYYTKTAKNAKK